MRRPGWAWRGMAPKWHRQKRSPPGRRTASERSGVGVGGGRVGSGGGRQLPIAWGLAGIAMVHAVQATVNARRFAEIAQGNRGTGGGE